jgi:uncharacterized membrane protein SpoIIM required for sporulation
MRRSPIPPSALAAALMVGGYAVSMSLASSPGAGTRAPALPLAQPLSTWSTFFTLVAHNSLVAIMIVAGGMSLGIVSVAQLWSIGYLFGLQVAHGAELGLTTERLLALTLPHALVEFTAFVLAGAAGFRIAERMGRYSWRGEPCAPRTVRRAIEGLGVALALLVVAGGIEAWLTPWCAERVQ